MACITSLEQDHVRGGWKGVAIRTGEVKFFRTLDDYKQHVKTLEDEGVYCPNVEPLYTVKYTKGQNTTPSGFLEFRPRDAIAQAKYSAMSSTWEGIASSEKAVSRGDFALDSADPKRDYKLPPPKLPPMPKEHPLDSPEAMFRWVRQSCITQ